MSTNYLQVLISVEDKEQTDKILDALLKKKIIAGGLMTKGPAKFWWKGEIVEMEYYNISAFTTEKHKSSIISEVKNISNEEVPMITFMSFEGNKEMLKWIDESVG